MYKQTAVWWPVGRTYMSGLYSEHKVHFRGGGRDTRLAPRLLTDYEFSPAIYTEQL
jgi:hypothetical protein